MDVEVLGVSEGGFFAPTVLDCSWPYSLFVKCMDKSLGVLYHQECVIAAVTRRKQSDRNKVITATYINLDSQ